MTLLTKSMILQVGALIIRIVCGGFPYYDYNIPRTLFELLRPLQYRFSDPCSLECVE